MSLDPSNVEKSSDHGTSTDETIKAASSSSSPVVYTMWLQSQPDLKMLGRGSYGQVWEVDNEIVLKAHRIFKQPKSDASNSDRYHYASDTLYNYSLLRDERAVLRLLQRQPHSHILEAIDTDQVEGIYIRRYQPLPDILPAQPTRIRWYREIVDALCHLHQFSIVHGDLRSDNILVDHRGSAILCDFSAASPFGLANHVFPDLPLPLNGPSPNLSLATDMFAMGSLMFQLEHGVKPELSVDWTSGELILPTIPTHNQGLDMIIRNAWLGSYSTDLEMLESLRLLDAQIDRGIATGDHGVSIQSVPISALKERVKVWREGRDDKHGFVLEGILSGDQLQTLADDHGLDRDIELRFTDHDPRMYEN